MACNFGQLSEEHIGTASRTHPSHTLAPNAMAFEERGQNSCRAMAAGGAADKPNGGPVNAVRGQLVAQERSGHKRNACPWPYPRIGPRPLARPEPQVGGGRGGEELGGIGDLVQQTLSNVGLAHFLQFKVKSVANDLIPEARPGGQPQV